MTVPIKQTQSWLAIYDGQRCIGHVIHRDKNGWEAFNTDDVSIGLFKSPAEAANALKPLAVQS
jgi:hypothetical protein